MSNEARAATKNFLLSKTVWANAMALAALFFPAVREWAAAELEAVVIILAFVNLVLRTVTSQPISISRDGDSGNGGASGGSGGILPLALALICAVCLLPSCAESGYPLSGTISYRDPDSGAKGGLVFVPGERPQGFVKVPIYDPETGELIGMGELSGPLAREIPASAECQVISDQ